MWLGSCCPIPMIAQVKVNVLSAVIISKSHSSSSPIDIISIFKCLKIMIDALFTYIKFPYPAFFFLFNPWNLLMKVFVYYGFLSFGNRNTDLHYLRKYVYFIGNSIPSSVSCKTALYKWPGFSNNCYYLRSKISYKNTAWNVSICT